MLKNNLKMLMAERNLTIKDVMKATGLSRVSMSNMINNPYANIALKNVDKLCKLLHVGVNGFYIDDSGNQNYLINPSVIKFDLPDEVKKAMKTAIKEAAEEIANYEQH